MPEEPPEFSRSLGRRTTAKSAVSDTKLIMADLAKNFDARVQAAWGMGDGGSYTILFNLTCVGNGNRALASDHLRVIDGQADGFLARNTNAVRGQLQTLTGFNCGASAFSCLQANGSGRYIVQNGQVQDESADHCYSRRTGAASGTRTISTRDGRTAGDPWELNANLDWLTGFTQR
jgi:hypothetical protein